MSRASSISGFPEYLPQEQIAFEKCKKIISDTFELYGFCPLSTPAVEKLDVLLSKGDSHEIYAVQRFADPPGKEKKLGLRFDLTVPLARYVSLHYNDLVFPFKRYQIDPVWRGERAQEGRYRQFYQCDIDVVGDGFVAVEYDALIISAFSMALERLLVGDFSVRLNNRKILISFVESKGIVDSAQALRIIDKKGKISDEEIISSLAQMGWCDRQEVSDWFFTDRSNSEWIDFFRDCQHIGKEFSDGVDEIEDVISCASKMGAKNIKITPSLARGLEYYTGSVFEVILDNANNLGSVCGGGRYANLANMFSSKSLPGVGASMGLSRLMPHIMDKFLDLRAIACVLVAAQDRKYMDDCIEISRILWGYGVQTEIYFDDKQIKHQIRYADKKGIRFMVIIGEEEAFSRQASIRDMLSGKQTRIRYEDVPGFIMGAMDPFKNLS